MNWKCFLGCMIGKCSIAGDIAEGVKRDKGGIKVEILMVHGTANKYAETSSGC